MKEDRKLNHAQACAVLGCKKTHFYRLIKDGRLKAFRLEGAKRGLWVLESECLALIEKIPSTDADSPTS